MYFMDGQNGEIIIIEDDDEVSSSCDSDDDFCMVEETSALPKPPPTATTTQQQQASSTAASPQHQDKQQHNTTTVKEEPAGMDYEEILLPKTNQVIAEEKKNEGNNHYKAQNYQSALKLYSDAISLCPDSAAYYGNRAACQMMLGNYKAALNDSRLAVSLDPKFEKGYVRIAKCNLLLGDLTGCEQAVKVLVELDGKNAVAMRTEADGVKQLRDIEQKATASYEKEDYRTTIYHMDNAMKIATACHRYRLLKAECLALLGRVDEAGDLAVNAMKLDGSCADATYVRGLCLYYSDNMDKALTHFERALQLDPDHKKAKQTRIKARQLKEKKERGNELFKAMKFKDALQCYAEALQVDKNNRDMNSKLFYNRALVNSKLGNLRDAISDCSDAFSLNGNYLKAILLRARCYNDLEMFEECVRDYELALSQEKTSEISRLLSKAKQALKNSKRKDYYKILGINKSANTDEIKKAYRKRAMVHHPDRHAHSTDAEKKEQEKKFKEVGEAYAVLSDPQKRTRYDNGQDIDFDGSGGHGPGFDFDTSQLFRQFYFNMDGGHGGRGGTSFHFG